MVSKEDFCLYLRLIRRDEDFYCALSGLSRDYKKQDTIDIYPESITVASELLKEVMDDTGDLIFQWIYEADFGRVKPLCFTDGTAEYTIKSDEDLYEYLASEKDPG